MWITRFPKGKGEYLIRPLTEPDEWQKCNFVWNKSINRGWPLAEGQIIDDDEGLQVQTRYLGQFIDIEKDRVIVFQVPKSVFDSFGRKFNRNGTVMDRDWLVIREGTGLDTAYDLEADEEVDRDLSKYVIPDIEEVLVNAYEHAVASGWTEGKVLSKDEVEEAKAGGKSAAAEEPEPEKPKTSRSRRSSTGEAEEPGQKDDGDLTADDLKDLPISTLRKMAKAKGINTSGFNRGEIIDAITGADSL